MIDTYKSIHEYIKSFLFLLFILFFLNSNLSAIDLKFDFGFNIASSQNNTGDIEQTIDYSMNYSDNILADIEYKVRNNETIINWNTETRYSWKYFELKNKVVNIKNKENNVSLEGLLQYPIKDKNKESSFSLIKLISNGHWKIGLRQSWDYLNELNGSPSTNIVIGKSFSKELRFFITPADFKYELMFSSNNFKYWDKETSIKASLKLLTFVDFFLKYKLIDSYNKRLDYFKCVGGLSLDLSKI